MHGDRMPYPLEARHQDASDVEAASGSERRSLPLAGAPRAAAAGGRRYAIAACAAVLAGALVSAAYSAWSRTARAAAQAEDGLRLTAEDEGCAEARQQCGGKGFAGTSCCQLGCVCAPVSRYYKQCQPPSENSSACDLRGAKHARATWTDEARAAKEAAASDAKKLEKVKAVHHKLANLVDKLSAEANETAEQQANGTSGLEAEKSEMDPAASQSVDGGDLVRARKKLQEASQLLEHVEAAANKSGTRALFAEEMVSLWRRAGKWNHSDWASEHPTTTPLQAGPLFDRVGTALDDQVDPKPRALVRGAVPGWSEDDDWSIDW